MTNHDDRSRRTAEILASAGTWEEAPDALDAVVAEIDPPAVAEPPRWRGILAGTVAAVVVLVVAVGVTSILRTEPIDFTLTGTELAPEARADVRVVETPAGVVLRLEVEGLAPAEPGTYYQGWVVAGDRAVSVGTFHMRGGDGSVAFWSGVDSADYPQLIVTLQVETGGPARSDSVVLTGQA